MSTNFNPENYNLEIKKVSELPSASTPASDDVVLIEQSGTLKKISATALSCASLTNNGVISPSEWQLKEQGQELREMIASEDIDLKIYTTSDCGDGINNTLLVRALEDITISLPTACQIRDGEGNLKDEINVYSHQITYELSGGMVCELNALVAIEGVIGRSCVFVTGVIHKNLSV